MEAKAEADGRREGRGFGFWVGRLGKSGLDSIDVVRMRRRARKRA